MLFSITQHAQELRRCPMTAETALMQDLETGRFVLRQTEASHFELLYQAASDPAVWAQHPESNRWQRPVFTAFFEGGLRNDLGCFTIFDRSRQAVIGSTRFYGYDAAESAVRLGYTFLAAEYWGSGANREIKDVLLNQAFQVVTKVFFDIGVNNIRSRKATEKLGAVEHQQLDDKVVYLLAKNTQP